MKPRVVGIIQARQGSTRFPGKTLTPIYRDQSTLEVMIQRLCPSRRLDDMVVATTEAEEDNPIVEMCQSLGIPVYRGSTENVLERYYKAAKLFQATHIVRLTADCPLHDYLVVDHLIEVFFASEVDCAANAIHPTYPDGFDAEIFTFGVLEKVYKEAVLPSDKEHVTSYVYRHPELFRCLNVPYHRDVSHVRLTFDEPRDLDVIKHVAVGLFDELEYPHLEDILVFLEQSEFLLSLNGDIVRNEGYMRSLEKERGLNNNV